MLLAYLATVKKVTHMNHRMKRRKKRLELKPEVIRHRQREANRAKLHAKQAAPEVSKKQFVDPPAAQVAPLFPTRVEDQSGVRVVEVQGGRQRRKPTPFWQSPPMANVQRVREPFTVVISKEATVIDAEPQ